MFRHLSAAALVLALFAPLAAQPRMDADINAKIRQEENSHSQIMKTLHMLADVYGPRVTGSPSLKAAGEWAIKQMQSWGFSNGHLEPWDFGHPGWVNERFSAHITAPVKDQLTCEVLAWTPGTDGTVTAQAYQLQMPDRPTPAQLDRVSRRRQGQGQRTHRAGRQAHARAGEHQPAGQAAPRRSGARAVRPEQPERRPVRPRRPRRAAATSRRRR